MGMSMTLLRLTHMFAALALVCSSAPVLAQGEPITAAERDSAVHSIAEAIGKEFYNAERAAEISAGLIASIDNGDYAAIDDANDLATALTVRLSEEDRHFRVNYVGMDVIREIEASMQAEEDSEEEGHADHGDPYAGLRRTNFGFARVEILAGNVGYIELRQFSPIEPALETATAALNFIGNTDAVIIDVRNNGGGEPSMVQFLISHFLAPGGETLINTFVSRHHEYPEQMWSLPSHPAGNRVDTPLYVLTSGGTGSAAEGFSYHLRAMERAILIGETTYGAGNPGGEFYMEEGYSIFISTGSAHNPITQSNWEGTGVEPHIAVDASTALDEALLRIYTELAGSADDPDIARSLTWAQESLAARLEPVKLSEEDLARYVGDFGIRDTRMENGQLMYLREGNPPRPLVALGDDRFGFAEDGRYRMVFRFDDGGRLEAMDLLVIDGRVIVNRNQN
jgi:hypothetical protein